MQPDPEQPTETPTSSLQSPETTADFHPVDDNQRIDVMDILRGFALIGILFMNIEWFNRPISALMQFDFSQTGGDWAASWLVKVLIEGKFYKLFSLLFGMGFAVMLLRAQQDERSYVGVFVRRMLALFVFGLLHMIFFWGGDILHDYAIGGLILLAWIVFIHKNNKVHLQQPRSFLRIGLIALSVPFIITTVVGLYFGATHNYGELEEKWQQAQQVSLQVEQQMSEFEQTTIEQSTENKKDALAKEEQVTDNAVDDNDEGTLTPEQEIQQQADERITEKQERLAEKKKEIDAINQSSFWEMTRYRISELPNVLMKTPFFALFMGFPTFMIGFWFIASGVMRNPEKHRVLFTSMTIIGLGGGLFISAVGAFISLHPATKNALPIMGSSQTLFFFGQYILVAGYFGAIVLLCLSERIKRMLSILAPLGRMALTNYLSHSVILTFVFYGYGLGQFGQINRTEQMAMVMFIIIAQLVFSTLWLKYFKFGPLEWCWRCITYWKMQPIRH